MDSTTHKVVGSGTQIGALVAGDSLIEREGISALLSAAELHVLGEASDAEGMLRKARAHQPAMTIITSRASASFVRECLAAARALRAEFPQMAIMVLAGHLESDSVAELLKENSAGLGFLLTHRLEGPSQIGDSIRQLLSGGTVIHPEVLSGLVDSRPFSERFSALTQRELEALALMSEGLTNRAISDRMTISLRAAEKHVGSIFEKLGLSSSPENHRRVLAVLAFVQREGQSAAQVA